MTVLAAELAPPVQPQSAWRPSGDEPQPCHRSLSSDRSCASDEALGVTFVLPAQPAARVTTWVYAASGPSGMFLVAWRWEATCGGWHASGWDSSEWLRDSLQDATDDALDAAVALACGEWDGFRRVTGGIPPCPDWDGTPW